MKILLLSLSIVLCNSLPASEDSREGRNIFANFLGNLGILRIIPRECSTTSSFLMSGMCSLESKCTEAGGAIAGLCERAGVCCVVPGVCGSKMAVKRSWFVNKEFPDAVVNSRSSDCELSIVKSDKDIKQVRLDFKHFKLGRAENGACVSDSFRVFVIDPVLGEIDLMPPLCGDNTNQHVFIDMPEGELGEIKIKVKVGEQKGRENPSGRSWRIFVTQLEEEEMAPKGCLQYYPDEKGEVRSLNYDADQSNFVGGMNYDICFRKMEELTIEAEETIEDEDKYVICGREFSGVTLDQSFTGSSNKILSGRFLPRQSRKSSSTTQELTAKDAKNDRVITQIQKVVSQLKGDKESGLRTVIRNSNRFSSLSKNEEKPPTVQKKDEKKDESKTDSEKKQTNEVKTDNSKRKEEEKKEESPKEVVPKKEDDKKKDEENNKSDITWLILDKDNKDKKTTLEVPAETLVSSGMKAEDEDKTETPMDDQEDKKPADDFNNKPLKDVFGIKENDVEPEPAVVPEPEPAVPEPQPEPQVISLREAEEVLKNPACGGAYILAREREVCGSFLRAQATEDKDKRFGDAVRISVRSIEDAETSLRFDFKYQDTCRILQRTTTTSSTTSTTSTTTSTTSSSSTSEKTTEEDPGRRVSIIRYLLGWY